jgi:hypothetical protein
MISSIVCVQGIKKEMTQKEPEVRQAIKQAEELVARSGAGAMGASGVSGAAAAAGAGAAGGQRDEVAQQVQKLKYNTSDLKLRFDTVSAMTEVNLL